MAMPGKEGTPVGVDELAVREVEGYIDRLEKQVESPSQTNQTKPAVSQVTTTSSQPSVIQNLPSDEKQRVVLPMEKMEIESNAKSSVESGVRWLSEWCVYMIKKYPGRIFYSPPKQNV